MSKEAYRYTLMVKNKFVPTITDEIVSNKISDLKRLVRKNKLKEYDIKDNYYNRVYKGGESDAVEDDGMLMNGHYLTRWYARMARNSKNERIIQVRGEFAVIPYEEYQEYRREIWK